MSGQKSAPEASGRAYRSPLRAQQAEQTRTLVAEAARERFLSHGWSGTTVRSVAEAAGVSEATVYAIYGSKAGLATSLIDSADAQADIERVQKELATGWGDPQAQVRAFVGFDRRLFENGGDVIRTILEGRRQHEALDAAYRDGRGRGEAVRREVFATWPASVWRNGMTVPTALDVYAVVCAFDTFDILRRERGWTADRIEQWWAETICGLLFAH